MRANIFAISAIFGSVFTGLAAADQPVPASSQFELRILGGVAPGFDKGYEDVQQRLGSTGELILLYHHQIDRSPLGIVVGGGFFDDGRRGKSDNPDNVTQYDAQGIVITGGLICDVSPHLCVEARAEVRAGYGRFSAEQTFSNGNFQVIGDYGHYYAGSAVGAVYYSLPFAVTVGLEAGYDTFQGKSDFVNNEVTLKGDGLMVRLGIGYRF